MPVDPIEKLKQAMEAAQAAHQQAVAKKETCQREERECRERIKELEGELKREKQNIGQLTVASVRAEKEERELGKELENARNEFNKLIRQ